MPSNGLNVGVDFNFGIYDQNTGGILNLGDVQSIKETANKHDLKSMPYNGVPRFAYVPDGYSGTFMLIRTGSFMEDLQVTLSNNFNNGVPIRSGFINKVVENGDGSVSKYQYIGVVFFLTEISDVSREKTVPQTVNWWASDKIKLA